MITTQIDVLTEPAMADFLDAVQVERGATEWQRLAGFMRDVHAGSRTVWVAYRDGRPIGMISARWRSDYTGFSRTPAAPEIVDLYVWTAGRRQGIGRALLNHAEHAVRQAGFQRVGLGVGILADDSAAWRLYLAAGYMFDETGAWWQGRPVTGDSVIDHTQAPVLVMMSKPL